MPKVVCNDEKESRYLTLGCFIIWSFLTSGENTPIKV